MVVIGVDFDNTISTHNYPFTGDLIPYAKEVINLLHKNGHIIVLWTVRGNDKINELGMRDPKGTMSALGNAKEFCESNGVVIDYYNSSPIHPSSSPKQWTHYLIDDTAVGCPMTFYHGHKVVDWKKIAELMMENDLLTKNDVDTLNFKWDMKNKRIEALKYTVGKHNGKISDLEKVIGKDIVNEFVSMGFIVDNDVSDSWKISRLGIAYLEEFEL